MSDQDKLPIAKGIHALGLIFYLLFIAVGLLYIFRGNWIIVILTSLLNIGLLSFFVSQLEKNKKSNTEENLKPEYCWGGFLLTLGLCSFFIINHAVSVEYSNKNQIIRAGKEKLDAISILVFQYEKETTDATNEYKDLVESNIDRFIYSEGKDTKYKDAIVKQFGEGTVDFSYYEKKPKSTRYQDSLRASVAIAINDDLIRMESKFDLGNIDIERKDYQEQAFPVFEYWERLQLNYYYYDIDNMYNKVYAKTKEKFPDFDYPATLNNKEINLDNFVQSLKGGTPLSLLGTLLLCFIVFGLLLAPYIAAERPAGPMLIKKGKKANSESNTSISDGSLDL